MSKPGPRGRSSSLKKLADVLGADSNSTNSNSNVEQRTPRQSPRLVKSEQVQQANVEVPVQQTVTPGVLSKEKAEEIVQRLSGLTQDISSLQQTIEAVANPKVEQQQQEEVIELESSSDNEDHEASLDKVKEKEEEKTNEVTSENTEEQATNIDATSEITEPALQQPVCGAENPDLEEKVKEETKEKAQEPVVAQQASKLAAIKAFSLSVLNTIKHPFVKYPAVGATVAGATSYGAQLAWGAINEVTKETIRTGATVALNEVQTNPVVQGAIAFTAVVGGGSFAAYKKGYFGKKPEATPTLENDVSKENKNTPR